MSVAAPPQPEIETYRPKGPPAWVTLLAAAAIGIGAFLVLRGGGDDAQAAAEAAVARTVVEATTSEDPSVCDRLYTDQWLATYFRSSTSAPLERCHATNDGDDHGEPPTTAEVSQVSVEGGRAQASARVDGGELGVAQVRVSLVNDGRWKLDRMLSISVDKQALLEAGRRSLASDSGPSRDLKECFLDYTDRHVGVQALDRSLLAGDDGFLLGSYRGCKSSYRRTLLSPRSIASSGSLSNAQARCVSAVIAPVMGRRQLREVFNASLNEEPLPAWFIQASQAAHATCADTAPGAA